MAWLFETAAKISLDDSEFNKGINSAGSKMSSFASNAGKIAGTIAKATTAGLAAAGTAAVTLITSATKQYAELEQLVGGTELMFGKATDTVIKNSKEAYKTVQMSQKEYLKQVNGFATGLKTALKGNEKAAADLAHKIVTAEADVVAATGATQEAVQNAFNGIMRSNFTINFLMSAA